MGSMAEKLKRGIKSEEQDKETEGRKKD